MCGIKDSLGVGDSSQNDELGIEVRSGLEWMSCDVNSKTNRDVVGTLRNIL